MNSSVVTPFVITIDTEGDNLWSRPSEITTHNARYLPRFQELCEKHSFRPTYLVNYEMALDPCFQEFGRDCIKRTTAEIGMHLHAWNSPPVSNITSNDCYYQPYLIEYPDYLLSEKVHYMTALLQDTFQASILSHRAGRWALDQRYISALIGEGYKVDCSVTPFYSWEKNLGIPNGSGGVDYTKSSIQPHRLPGAVGSVDSSYLLEVPMTVFPRCCASNAVKYVINKLNGFGLPLAHRMYDLLWLRPNGRNITDMLDLVRNRGSLFRHLEFMLHSSELMPGGSPYFRNDESVEKLYRDLDKLFDYIKVRCESFTLSDFINRY